MCHTAVLVEEEHEWIELKDEHVNIDKHGQHDQENMTNMTNTMHMSNVITSIGNMSITSTSLWCRGSIQRHPGKWLAKKLIF